MVLIAHDHKNELLEWVKKHSEVIQQQINYTGTTEN